MNRFLEFLNNLVASDPYMPHGHCILWEKDTLLLHIISDILITTSYFSIPLTIVYFLHLRGVIRHKRLIAMFAAFIFLCGVTHVNSIVIFWYPFYKFEGVIKLITGIVSLSTAILLFKKLPLFIENYDEIRENNVQLKRMNESLENYAHIAAHDLRVPLRSLLKITDWVEQDIGDDASDDMKLNLGYMRKKITRMDRFLYDMLEYHKLDSQVLSKNFLFIVDIIENVIDDIMLPDSCSVMLHENVKNLSVPEMPFYKIFLNLISNAIKHGNKRQITIDISCRRGDRYTIFCVADNGVGIEKKNFKKIFKMLVRLESKSIIDGSGIGLAATKKAIENIEGNIWVESEYGQGTAFYFKIPNKVVK